MTLRRRLTPAAVVVLLLGLMGGASADAHTLSYSKAKKAAKREADRVAEKSTKVKSLRRISRHRIAVRAEWKRTRICMGCLEAPDTGAVYDTEIRETCVVRMIVRFRTRRSRRVVVRVKGRSCSA